jgi:hypothetical protein
VPRSQLLPAEREPRAQTERCDDRDAHNDRPERIGRQAERKLVRGPGKGERRVPTDSRQGGEQAEREKAHETETARHEG